MDYSPSVERKDGILVDMYIEDIMAIIYNHQYDAPHFDEVFTGIIRHYINEDAPDLKPSIAGADKVNLAVVNFLLAFSMSFTVISKSSKHWPIGGFPYLPNAVVAVSISHMDEDYATHLTPGENLTQAVLAAMMQLARELSMDNLNQRTLTLLDFEGAKLN